MNILYISHLMGNKYSGMTVAVPKHIQAQAKINNVFWFNTCVPNRDLSVPGAVCHTLQQYPIDLSSLPDPFNKPDLIIFHGFYLPSFLKLAKQARKMRIPYIIVPHGSLTRKAQEDKALKKTLANWLLFNRFAHQAKAIHYLTQQEYENSGNRWNKQHFILPNGTDIPIQTVSNFMQNDQIRGVFIGRLSIRYKGLDLLLQAIAQTATQLRQHKVILNVYGKSSLKEEQKLQDMLTRYQIADLVQIHPPVFDQQKEEILLASDFFVLTSRSEGHPMGLIEALSYGLPCLITTGTNMRAEVETYQAGWTTNINVPSIAKALLELINSNRQTFINKGIQARKLAKQYNWDTLAQQASHIYSNMVSKGN